MTDRVKILFLCEGGTAGPEEIESMWAIPTIGGFRIDNIPFYAREIATGDIVSAKRDTDGVFWFDTLLRASQHSTVRLWFAKNFENEVLRIRQELRSMGCPSELSDLNRLVAVDIPPTVPYDMVRDALEKYEREGLLEYEESCIGKENMRTPSS